MVFVSTEIIVTSTITIFIIIININNTACQSPGRKQNQDTNNYRKELDKGDFFKKEER
jgi:preprotein translocase subunit YajC